MQVKFNKKLMKGSLVLMVFFGIFNFFNFLFHFSMARMLSVADYGILATLFSIIYFLGVFSESVQMVITKYTSKTKGLGKIKNILNKSLRKSAFISIGLLLIYLILAVPLSKLLKVSYSLFGLNGLIIFIVFFSPIPRGILQGMKRFNHLGINMAAESILKLFLAVIFVYLGGRVYGAIVGNIVGTTAAFFLSAISLRDVISSEEKKADTDEIYGYAKPAFVVILTLLAFISVDVILAKIFFSEDIAGAYAIASTLAKSVFFGTSPISKAMFPITAESSKKSKSESILINAAGLVVLLVVFALTAFYLFPDLIVRVFSGRTIYLSSSVLFYIGVAVGITCFTNLILLYELSLGNVKKYWVLPLFLVLEIVLLSIFSSSLVEFSVAYMAASAVFLWGAGFLLKSK